MDISEEYIEMSKALPDEMLDLWEPTEGDYFAVVHRNQHTYIDVYYNCPEEDNLAYVKNPIWLRRQDQLQDMLINVCREKYNFSSYSDIEVIGEFLVNLAEYNEYTSFEQMYLSEVVNVWFSKRWDSDKKRWV